MALEDDVRKWLSTQEYTADQKITPFQRLRSKYLPPAGVKTWGEWYESLGVTPPKKKTETKRSSGVSTSGNAKKLQAELDAAQNAYDSFRATNRDKRVVLEQNIRTAQNQVESAQRSKDADKYNKASSALKRYQSQLDDLEDQETALLDELNQAKKIYKTERNLAVTEQDIKFREETGQAVSAAEREKADELRRQRDALRGVETPQAQPSFGPPEVRGGQAVPGTGGGVTTPVQQTTQPTEPKTPKQTQTGVRGQTGTTGGTGGAGGTGGKETTGNKGGKGKEETPAQGIDSVIEAAKGIYGGIDEVFRTNPELQALIKKAIGKVNDPTDNYDTARFISELENTTWWKTNAGPIRQRGFYKRQYDELVKGIKSDDPNYEARIAELNRTSEYGRGLVNVMEDLRNNAKTIGVQVDEPTLTIIAKNLYDYANEGDATKIREALLGSGKFAAGDIYTGQAGANIRTLREVAAANGLDFDTQFKNSKDTWLSRIAQGESIETFKDLIRKSAQNAWTVDDRTRALLDQGVDLETIYAPFKKYMADILELPEEKITLTDLAKKGVIGGEKPMNLYDFRKALRQDERWQYTENARTEMSNLTENLLRDFGFVR